MAPKKLPRDQLKRSAANYRKNDASRKRKNAAQRRRNKLAINKKSRAEHNKARRKAGIYGKGGPDMSLSKTENTDDNWRSGGPLWVIVVHSWGLSIAQEHR